MQEVSAQAYLIAVDRRRVVRLALGANYDFAVLGCAQGEREPGDPASEYEKIGDDRQSYAFLA